MRKSHLRISFAQMWAWDGQFSALCLVLAIAPSAPAQEAIRMSQASEDAAQARREAANMVKASDLRWGPSFWLLSTILFAMKIARNNLLLACCCLMMCVGTRAADITLLWHIGRLDTNTSEFALAPNNYAQFLSDGLFIVGKSDPARNWPYVHPGPEDDWAGSCEHTFQIAFGLKKVPPAGTGRLMLAFVDTHMSKPPQMVARVNGREFTQALPKGKGNDAIEGRVEKNHSYRWDIKIPMELLKTGDNLITLNTVSGSWALYDYVALETPAGAESSPVSDELVKRFAQTDPNIVPGGDVSVRVDCSQVVNTMRGGMGASWHAMETLIPYGVTHPHFNSYSHGGSGWGAYPPAEDERAWKQIYQHARWLGLDWNRVEIEQRIYEPERGQFTLDSPEMRILYRILDWNQTNRADVFLQQMWCNVDWLAYPEFRGDPVGRVHSAPADLEAFADGLATLIDHLINKRRYTCIKWLCINNEPNANFSWWQAPPNKPLSIGPGLTAVRRALDARGLKVPLSGPDTTTGFPAKFPDTYDYLPVLGAYDFHDYGADFDFRTRGHIVGQVRHAALWAQEAHKADKPLFLSEFGTMAYGWLPDKPGPSCPQSVLAGSELVLRLANAGVDGFNRWSFLNRGDLDGQWQMLDTWDPQKKKLLEEYRPHPNSYFCLGLLSRFTAKNSAVLSSIVEGGKAPPWQRVFCAAFRSPAGELTIALINDAPAEYNLKLEWQALPKSLHLYRYRYGEDRWNQADVKVNPEKEFSASAGAGKLRDTLSPNSLTIYSSYKLEHGLPGIITEP